MKAAPVWKALAERKAFAQVLVHTGQHYDVNMSDVFFADLGLPAPDHYLAVGSGSHAQQTAAIMVAFERVVQEMRPDLVLVYGDVNSTLAAALVCAKLAVPLAHVEAGLRSFDRTMPEEINRLLTDQLADLLFTPSPDGDMNLLREGVPANKVSRVGNVMIDSLVSLLPASSQSAVLERLSLAPMEYAVLTLHRPSNVDDDVVLGRLFAAIADASQRMPVVFPVHPRARQRIGAIAAQTENGQVCLIDPLGYLDFVHLMSCARLVLTDSGGIQEETTYLRVPCLTLRDSTERPITVEMGTNTLVGRDVRLLAERFSAILDGDETWNRLPSGGIPLWDGCAAQRIAQVVVDWSSHS